MSRTMAVARMQLINKWTYIGWPLTILAASFLMSLAIFALIPVTEGKNGGGSQAPLWYFLVLGIQSMTLVFPFSQGLSISRKAFYLGTLGLFSLIAVGMTVLYMLGGVIEKATNGWGVYGYFFNIPWVTDGPWYSTAAFFFVVMMFMFIIGFWFATVFKRWGTTGTLISTLGTGLLLIGVAALSTLLQWWGAIGAWFAQQSPLSISGWAALLCVVLAAGSYTTLRKATP
ncbi:hypothetical protein J2790_001055 [Paenarthrobacter nicotinovorans]|uniref:ABC transporter permease n=1 Tax=Paenarthrobacter nicotinovorans TaxID=29320 RepID=A0ABV0GVD2_PAENI|nr:MULTISPECIES: hypothetical protein [Micrococcaceae]MDR6435934.1 hypothetical protein [Paenarthrobacter nicotinovorans]BCW59332.1 hypothetical protein StoSoilB20_26790 [Arthrobacter sp. StoSoilB20]SCZ51132.1 hypothetical protein SAMN02799638_00797 [Arthrobacter sp. UNCCL28]